jgi:DNA-binding transcriptional regulator YiaG
MNIFNELQTSLKEAVDIKHGKAPATRTTRHEVADVKAIRAKLHVSQAEFARAMGTSVDTIRSWETKRRNPTGLAAKVLATIQDNPAFFNELSLH